MLCFADDGDKKIGKSWSLLVYLSKTRKSKVDSQEMAKFGKFVDFQIFSEVRRSRELRFDPRPNKFKYPMYKDEKQNGPDLKETFEKCRKMWGDIGLYNVLSLLYKYDLTPEQPEQ